MKMCITLYRIMCDGRSPVAFFKIKYEREKSLKLAEFSDNFIGFLSVSRNDTIKFLHSHKANLSHLPLSPSSGGVFFKDFSLILNMHLNT